jgi:hypothetical protein
MLERVQKPLVFVIVALGALACRSKVEPAPEPAAVASAAGVCQACGSEPVHSEKDVVAPALARPGDLTRCPVSTVVFRVEPDSPRVEHAGKRGYVCCEGCKQHFDAAPAKFAQLL